MRYLIVRVFNFNEGRLPMFRRYLSPLRNLLLVAAWVTVLFSLAMTATLGHAAAPTAVLARVVGPSSPVQVGDQFVVTIQIEGATNLGAFEFEFGANPAIATTTVADIHLGTFVGSTGRTTGELRLASSPSAPSRLRDMGTGHRPQQSQSDQRLSPPFPLPPPLDSGGAGFQGQGNQEGREGL